MRAKPWEVPDGLWERVEPLLPQKERRFRYPGRKPFDDRLALQGILFVLHTGIGWEHLPQELGFGCGMTAWRRLRAWQQAGVWERLHELLLAELHAADQLEWERAVADSSHLQAKKGARRRVPAPSLAVEQAASTICSSTAAVSRSPGRSPAATATTSPSCSNCSTGSRRCVAASAARDGGPAR
jgi:transposase